jgi:hypothetical protein
MHACMRARLYARRVLRETLVVGVGNEKTGATKAAEALAEAARKVCVCLCVHLSTDRRLSVHAPTLPAQG